MKRKPLKEVIRKVLDDRKQILREEAAYYEDLAHANSSYWGYGGPVGRQEKAAEKRRREIEEVEELERQLRHSVDLDRVKTFSWYCRECGAVTMTTKYPEGEWHECGSCRKMIHKANVLERHLEVTRTCDFGKLMRLLKEEDMKGGTEN